MVGATASGKLKSRVYIKQQLVSKISKMAESKQVEAMLCRWRRN